MIKLSWIRRLCKQLFLIADLDHFIVQQGTNMLLFPCKGSQAASHACWFHDTVDSVLCLVPAHQCRAASFFNLLFLCSPKKEKNKL